MAFPTGWGRKVALTIDATYVSGSGSHTDFPVVLTLDSIPTEAVDAGSNSALNGGGDIRFSSDSAGSTQLPCEIVSYVTNASAGSRECEIWVKVPTLSASTNTTIYMWYNKTGETQPAFTDTYGRNAVWSDYAGVYHGDDNTDSSGNQDLVPNGTDYSGNTNGILGDCFSFPGTSGQRHTAAQSSLTTDPATLQCWFYSDADANNGQGLVSAHESGGKGWFRLTNQDNASGNPLRAQATQSNNTNSISDTTTGVTAGGWHLGHGVFNSDGSTAVYLDGGNQVTNSTTTSITALELFAIGEWDNGAGFIQPADGYIDEARFRIGALSSDWVATEYNSVNSASLFVTAGTPESAGGGGGSTLTVQSLSQSQSISQPSLTQTHTLTVSGLSQAQAITQPGLTQAHILTVAGLTQGQIIGNVTLIQGGSISPDNLAQAQSVGSPSLTQHHLLTVQNVTQFQTIDNVSFAVGVSLAVNSVNQGQLVSSPTLTQAHVLAVADLMQSQSVENASLVVQGQLTPDGLTQSQTIDAATLIQHHALSVQSLLQSQTVDNATLSAFLGLSVNDLTQSQSVDQPSLSAVNILSVDSLTQSQLIDAVTFGGAVIGYLRGELVIAAMINGEVTVTKLLDGSVTLN